MNDIQSREPIRLVRCLMVAAVLWIAAVPGFGEEPVVEPPEIGVWGGWYEPGRHAESLELGVDLRLDRDLFRGIRPHFGILVTADDSLYTWGGFRLGLPMGESRWRLDLSTAVGLFEEGDGKDLGGVMQFRSGIDALWRLPRGGRIGIGFYHISNAGLYDLNPGSNSLLFRYVLGGDDD